LIDCLEAPKAAAAECGNGCCSHRNGVLVSSN
jgi:hypothetical protein